MHLTRQFYPATGGIETVVYKLCQRQLKDGLKASVLTFDRVFDSQKLLSKKSVIDDIEVTRVSGFGPRQYHMAFGILDYFRDYDLIHLHSTDFFLDFSAIMKKRHKKPMIITSHGFYFHSAKWNLFKRIYFRVVSIQLLKRLNAVICVSEQDKKLLKANINPEVIPNGVELPEQIIPKLPSNGKIQILSINRLDQNKGVLDIIKVLAALRNKIDFEYHLVGQDFGVLQDLLHQVKQLNLEKNVIIHGRTSESKKEELLRECQIYLSASTYESFGISLLEAISYGKICVANDIEAYHELISHGENGFITNFKDTSSTAAFIKSLILRPDLLKISQRAIEKSREYGWNSVHNKYLKIYKNAIYG